MLAIEITNYRDSEGGGGGITTADSAHLLGYSPSRCCPSSSGFQYHLTMSRNTCG